MIDGQIFMDVKICLSRIVFIFMFSQINLFNDPSQVLMNVLSSRKNMSDSLAYGRLHPQLQPNTLLVDCEFFWLIHQFYIFDPKYSSPLQIYDLSASGRLPFWLLIQLQLSANNICVWIFHLDKEHS